MASISKRLARIEKKIDVLNKRDLGVHKRLKKKRR